MSRSFSKELFVRAKKAEIETEVAADIKLCSEESMKYISSGTFYKALLSFAREKRRKNVAIYII